MRHLIFLVSVCGLLTAGLSWVVADEMPEEEVVRAGRLVVGTGTAYGTLEQQMLRFDAQLIAQGNNLGKAVAHLQSQREQLEKQFKELHRGEVSLKFGSTRRYQSIIAARRARGEAPVAEPETGVYVTVPVHAQWTLIGENADEWLLSADGIERGLKSADLGWAKLAFETPPGAPNGFPRNLGRYPPESGLQAPDGHPMFSQSLGDLSTEQRSRMLAEAYQIARENAEQLARAANRRLGELHTLKRVSATPDLRSAQFDFREPAGSVTVEAAFELLPAQDK